MTNKTIIIDAAHREETRVAVLENNILQDFDREALAVKHIKGNIYLAKVTRVEPSLQAAFVDYGEDRHGFLPFADIHPEYYNLPEAEKQKLKDIISPENPAPTEEAQEVESAPAPRDEGRPERDRDENRGGGRGDRPDRGGRGVDREEDSEATITTGSYSVEDETEQNHGNIHTIYKRYNIQDVIKPNQVLLVQATKEERGNKGASMTTYISLAGKYCVLMSNTPNKGGVSRKVDNFRDRKILKAILSELAISADRSVIIRTAGVSKKPEEIKRDYEYLSRLWDSIREMAKTSTAPTFVHAEDDVIKRCIRDVYNEQVSEVVIEGQQAFDSVSNFIKATMPYGNHNIKLHDERVPVFNKYRVEQQISALYEKNILLKSGGSIVVDHTEALVAIDVNSGRATKESGVEETAFSTNLEAAREIARQLRLRDLAGLIVIDFIDMYDQKHRRAIERTLRDELQNDRARIQLGRISTLGLLEMSRQRLGASLFETITEPCKHCSGTGYIRSVEILAVGILRAVRHACADSQVGVIYVNTSHEVISYIANYKRQELTTTEKNYNVHIFMHHSDDVGNAGFAIKKRKGLSDEERRELEMEVTTGKVNQLGLERSFIDSEAAESDSTRLFEDATPRDNDRSDDRRNDRGDNRGGDRRDNNRDRRNNNGGRNNNNNRFNNNNKRYRSGDRRFDDRGGNRGGRSEGGNNGGNNGGKSILGSIFKMFK